MTKVNRSYDHFQSLFLVPIMLKKLMFSLPNARTTLVVESIIGDAGSQVPGMHTGSRATHHLPLEAIYTNWRGLGLVIIAWRR